MNFWRRVFLVMIIILSMCYFKYFFKDVNFIDKSSLIFFRIINILAIIYFIFLYVLFLPKTYSKNVFKRKISFKNDKRREVPVEFEEIYKTLYEKNIYKYKELQKNERINVILLIILTTTFCFLYLFYEMEEIKLLLQCLPILIILGMIFFFYARHMGKYEESFKKEIILSLVKMVSEQLTYTIMDKPRESDYTSTYINAEFDDYEFNQCFSGDYIEGFLDKKTYIKMVDFHLKCRQKNGITKDIFKGLFTYTDIDNYIDVPVKISTRKKLNKNKKIEMDSTQFEKYFDVYSNDRIITMKCITHDMMDILLFFQEKCDIDFEVVFKENKVYMRFFVGNMFEPRLFGNPLDKDLIFTYLYILKLVLDISKEVNKSLDGTIV